MPSLTVEQFVEAVKATVLANKRWVAYLSPFLVLLREREKKSLVAYLVNLADWQYMSDW